MLEMRADVHDHINSFDADEQQGRKRKLGGPNLVSVIISQQGC